MKKQIITLLAATLLLIATLSWGCETSNCSVHHPLDQEQSVTGPNPDEQGSQPKGNGRSREMSIGDFVTGEHSDSKKSGETPASPRKPVLEQKNPEPCGDPGCTT